MFQSKILTQNIKAIVCALGEEKDIEKELKEKALSENKIKAFRENFGYKKHFVTDENTYASDLASKVLQSLFDEKILQKNELDKLIVVSHTPDFFTPSLSQLIHKNLGLNSKTLCVDFCFFCTGFLQGLYEAFLSFADENLNNVVLICVSVKSKKLDKKDLVSTTSISDSASATLITRSTKPRLEKFAFKILSEFACEETRPTSAYKKGFSEFIVLNQNLFFKLVCENFPKFYEKFLEKNKEKNLVFLQSANEFFYKKLRDLLPKNHNFFNQNNFANTDANHLPLNLSLYASGGGLCL